MSVPVLPGRKATPAHWPGAELAVEVSEIGLVAVVPSALNAPLALSVPLTRIPTPLAACTTIPPSSVRVPLTVRLPLRVKLASAVYGPLASSVVASRVLGWMV